MTAPTPDPAAPDSAPENVLRGLLLALIVIPIGIVVWALVSSVGALVAIVALAVAIAAVWLYRRGSGGRVGAAGVVVIAAVVLVTVVLGFLTSLLTIAATIYAGELGATPFEAVQHSGFGTYLGFVMPLLLQENALTIVLAVVLGALGVFGSLRRARPRG